MGKRTSVYLSNELDAAVKASGVPLGELIRRGLGERAPEEAAAEYAAQAVRDDVRVALRGLAAEAAQGAHDDAQAGMAEIVERAVKSALREAQGGSW